MIVSSIVIQKKKGLHARVASEVFKVCGSYKAMATFSWEGKEAVGNSVLDLLMLAAPCGSGIGVTVTGEDEQKLFDALNDYLGSED